MQTRAIPIVIKEILKDFNIEVDDITAKEIAGRILTQVIDLGYSVRIRPIYLESCYLKGRFKPKEKK